MDQKKRLPFVVMSITGIPNIMMILVALISLEGRRRYPDTPPLTVTTADVNPAIPSLRLGFNSLDRTDGQLSNTIQMTIDMEEIDFLHVEYCNKGNGVFKKLVFQTRHEEGEKPVNSEFRNSQTFVGNAVDFLYRGDLCAF